MKGRTHTSVLFVYLVVRGDVESHAVLSAHLSFDHAEKSAMERMGDDDERYAECVAEPGEVAVWERVGEFNGRLHGYFAIEAFELQDEGNWTCTYDAPMPEMNL